MGSGRGGAKEGTGLWPGYPLVSDPSLHSGQPSVSIALTPSWPSAPGLLGSGAGSCQPGHRGLVPFLSPVVHLSHEECGPSVRAQHDDISSRPIFYVQAQSAPVTCCGRSRGAAQGPVIVFNWLLAAAQAWGGFAIQAGGGAASPQGHLVVWYPFQPGTLLSFRPRLA